MALLLGPALALAAEAPSPALAPHIPLCAGLSIVTAISQKDGDYESIKTIESMSTQSMRLKYSSEHMTQDIFSAEPPKLEKVTLYRQVLSADQAAAIAYLEQFNPILPEQVAGTTSIGTSMKILEALKAQAQVPFGFFSPMSGQARIPADHSTHPNVYDFQMMSSIHRIERAPVMLPVIVNDAPALLPAIHAAGTFFGDKAEFYFLDDPANPLTLKFRFGIDAVTVNDAGKAAKRDRDDLEVIKIAYNCSDAPASNAIEQQLSTTGKAEVYDIYFSFNSDQIRDESEPGLSEIAAALAHHSDWKLAVNGHTDNVGADPYNLALSKKRADAVKIALVSRYHVDASRLSSDGFGASQPQDTNATLEGRAHNRRVELIRR
jgi:outer membrane protein OmpA-like peptidoglycan-associated protein